MENTIDELFETAEALLALADTQRDLADAKPTEALALRMNAAKYEAEALEVLRELIEARGCARSPEPTKHLDAEAPSPEALVAVLKLRDIEKRCKIS